MSTEINTVKNWKVSFATIFTGQAFSIVGSAAVQFAIIWWITYQTESAISLAFATIAAFLPNVFIGPFAGVWADRYNRRAVMMVADGFVALSSVVMMLVFMSSTSPPLWVIYAVLFARGLGATFHQPAMQAAIPQLVPGDMLTKANGWSSLVTAAGSMLGPMLGALLMGLTQIQYIMLVDIAGAVIAIISLCFVKIPNVQQRGEKTHVLADMRVGLAAVRKNRPLVAGMVPFIIINLMGAPLGTLFPLLIRTHFGGTQWHNGIAELVFATGMMIGSAVIGMFGNSKRRFLIMSAAMFMLGLFAMIIGMLAPWAFVIFAVISFLFGAANTFVTVPFMAYIQETTPAQQMGKVLSLLMAALSLTVPLGLVVAGPLSETVGITTLFLISAAVIVVMASWFFCATRKYDKQANAELDEDKTEIDEIQVEINTGTKTAENA